MMKKIGLLALFLISGIAPLFSFAHPGRTAADGCHYCRTNCDKRGVAWNERHCHGGYTPTYTAKTVVKAKPVVKKTVLTANQKCAISYPGTIYRSSDKRCACAGDKVWTSTWNKYTKSCPVK